MPNTLAVNVFAHDIPDWDKGLCWTFITAGLLAYGQPEIIVSVAREADEHPAGVTDEVANLMRAFHRMASEGGVVDVGDVGLFRQPAPFGCRGVAYIRPRHFAGVDMPYRAITAIPLMGPEFDVADAFGVTRVMARLGRHYRYYPCPFWWERGRPPIASAAGDETSLLAGFRVAKLSGVSARVDHVTELRDTSTPPSMIRREVTAIAPRGITLRVNPFAREELARMLDAAPRDAAFALLTEPDPDGDGLSLWFPGMNEWTALASPGSRGERLSLAFLGFAIGVSATGGDLREDGAVFTFTEEAWSSLRNAIADAEPLTIEPTRGQMALHLEFIPTEYVSPIDGTRIAIAQSWKTVYATAPEHGSPGMRGPVVFLTAEQDVESRVSPSALIDYLRALESDFLRECRARNIRMNIVVRVRLFPGQAASGMVRGEVYAAPVMEALRRVPSPIVIGGEVVVEFRLTTQAGAPTAGDDPLSETGA